jgi:hypothetical protein
LLILGVVGLLSGDEEPQRKPALSETDRTPSPSPEPSPTPVATDAGEDPVVAVEDGIELEIIAMQDCWTMVSVDGGEPTTQTILAGDSMTFTAEEEVFVRLGFPDGVELVVNGESIGTPGGVNPVNLTFPDDIDQLL